MRQNQRQVDRDRMEHHLRCVDEMRQLAMLGEMNPSEPTHFKRGGWDRLVLMTLRNEMGLPLFVPGDCEDDDGEPPDLSNKPRPFLERCRMTLEKLSRGRFDGHRDDELTYSHEHGN